MNITELDQKLAEGVHDPHIFKAIFMAGSPGAGKTTIRNKLFGGTGLRVLDVDDFWKLYNKQNKDQDYLRFFDMAIKRKDNYIQGRLGLILDGTARDLSKIAASKHELENLGYDTAMVFVNTNLETAIDRAQLRGQQTGRFIKPSDIKTFWHLVQNNLGSLQNMFSENFLIVDNNDQHPDLTYADKALRRFLAKPPTHSAAREWIQLNNRQDKEDSSILPVYADR